MRVGKTPERTQPQWTCWFIFRIVFVCVEISTRIYCFVIIINAPGSQLRTDSMGGLKFFSTFFDGYCSTVQGLIDWFEVDLGFTELSSIQIDLCVLCVFVLYSRVSLSSCPFWTFCTASPARWECLWSQPSILSVP